MKVKNKLKKLFLAIIPVFCVLALFTVPKVDAADKHKRLFLGVLLDEERGGIYMDVVEEEGAKKRIKDWSKSTTSVGGSGTFDENGEGYCGGGVVTTRCHYLYYPGVKYDDEQGYTSKDEALALNAANILTSSISTIVQQCDIAANQSINEGNNFQTLIDNLANTNFETLTEARTMECYGSKTIDIAPVGAGFTVNTDGVNMGTKSTNFVRIRPTGSNGNWETIQWSVPKGYSSGQYNPSAWTSGTEMQNPEFISVSGVAWWARQASENSNGSRVAGAAGYDDLYGYDKTERIIVNFFSSINSGIAKFLGINTVDNLIFNRGPVGYNYYLGMMPTRWMEVAKIFYWISMVVGMFILMYGYLVSIGRISLSSISPSVRITLKDTFLNYALVVVLQILFVPIFNLASNINFGLVKAISTLAGAKSITAIGTSGVLSGIISSLASIGISIAINIQYLHRGLMIALLFASAPIFIASIVIDPQRKMFGVWCKELFAYVFMQTFNAIILAFLFMVTF